MRTSLLHLLELLLSGLLDGDVWAAMLVAEEDLRPGVASDGSC